MLWHHRFNYVTYNFRAVILSSPHQSCTHSKVCHWCSAAQPYHAFSTLASQWTWTTVRTLDAWVSWGKSEQAANSNAYRTHHSHCLQDRSSLDHNGAKVYTHVEAPVHLLLSVMLSYIYMTVYIYIYFFFLLFFLYKHIYTQSYVHYKHTLCIYAQRF